MSNIHLRPYEAADHNFVLNSWLKSYRNSDFAKKIDNETYYKSHAILIASILATATTIIACDPEAHHVIYGYLCWTPNNDSPDCFHYCYVKGPFRKMGIAKVLVTSVNPGSAYIVTHLTDSLYRDNLTYHPYLLGAF